MIRSIHGYHPFLSSKFTRKFYGSLNRFGSTVIKKYLTQILRRYLNEVLKKLFSSSVVKGTVNSDDLFKLCLKSLNYTRITMAYYGHTVTTHAVYVLLSVYVPYMSSKSTFNCNGKSLIDISHELIFSH